MFRTRFAPSPTGPLHLGHAYSAILAHDMAGAAAGAFLLRIEDIDRQRARDEWEQAIYRDLNWLGLSWEKPVLRQSERLVAYGNALQHLWDAGLVYPCTCSRRDIAQALSAPQEGQQSPTGPDGLIYPGTCRPADHFPAKEPGPMPRNQALRLNLTRALRMIAQTCKSTDTITFVETGSGPLGQTGTITYRTGDLEKSIGDIVLARRDFGTSYHLSVVLDDAAQKISHVVRGADLFEATVIHVILQKLLNLPTPIYHHHRLIRDDTGKRLAKRDDARAIAKFRNDGAASGDIRRLVGL